MVVIFAPFTQDLQESPGPLDSLQIQAGECGGQNSELHPAWSRLAASALIVGDSKGLAPQLESIGS